MSFLRSSILGTLIYVDSRDFRGIHFIGQDALRTYYQRPCHDKVFYLKEKAAHVNFCLNTIIHGMFDGIQIDELKNSQNLTERAVKIQRGVV